MESYTDMAQISSIHWFIFFFLTGEKHILMIEGILIMMRLILMLYYHISSFTIVKFMKTL